MEKINLQFLQSELNRVCEWIKFSDKKTGFLSAYYSTIFGLLISQKESILNNILNYQKVIGRISAPLSLFALCKHCYLRDGNKKISNHIWRFTIGQ